MFGWLGKGKSDLVAQTLLENHNDTYWTRWGEDVMATGNVANAIKCFDKAVELNPRNHYAWGDKALALDYLKKYEEALECYNKALECNPKSAITWHNMGLTLTSLKRLEEAVQSFEKALEINPKYAKAWYNKGRLLSKLDNDSEAQRCLNVAKKLDPLMFIKLKGR